MSEVLTEDGVPRALTSDKYPDPERLSDPTLNLYRVQAVADLTGRGVMDIVVEGRDALGTWSTVYGWRRGQSHRFTLFSECGTWER